MSRKADKQSVDRAVNDDMVNEEDDYWDTHESQAMAQFLTECHPVGEAISEMLAHTLTTSDDPLTSLYDFQQRHSLHPRFVRSTAPMALLDVLGVPRTVIHSRLLKALSDRFIELVNKIDLEEDLRVVLPVRTKSSAEPSAKRRRSATSAAAAAAAAAAGATAGSRTKSSSARSASAASYSSRKKMKGLRNIIAGRNKRPGTATVSSRQGAKKPTAAPSSLAQGSVDAEEEDEVSDDNESDQELDLSTSSSSSSEYPEQQASIPDGDDDDDDDNDDDHGDGDGDGEYLGDQSTKPSGGPRSSSSSSNNSVTKKSSAQTNNITIGGQKGTRRQATGKRQPAEIGTLVIKKKGGAVSAAAGAPTPAEQARDQERTRASKRRDTKSRNRNLMMTFKKKKTVESVQQPLVFRFKKMTNASDPQGGPGAMSLATSHDGKPAESDSNTTVATSRPAESLERELDTLFEDELGAAAQEAGGNYELLSSAPQSVEQMLTLCRRKRDAALASGQPASASRMTVPAQVPQKHGLSLLDRLLHLTFPYLGFEELRPAGMAVLAKHPSVPTSLLNTLAESPELFEHCPMVVRRQIWRANDVAFRNAVLPILTQYIEAAESDAMALGERRSVVTAGDLCVHGGEEVPAVEPPRRRRERSEPLAALVDMMDTIVPLYDAMLHVFRTFFAQYGEPLFCSLRADLLMMLHDRSLASVYELDPCHGFAWCLDACVADGSVSERHLAQLRSIVVPKRGSGATAPRGPVVQDMAMVARAPATYHLLVRATFAALASVVEQEAIPSQDDRLMFLSSLLDLATGAWASANQQSRGAFPKPRQPLGQAFFPLLAGRILDDTMRELAGDDEDEPPEPVDDALTVWLTDDWPVPRQLCLYYTLTRIRANDAASTSLLLRWIYQSLGPSKLYDERDFVQSLCGLLLEPVANESMRNIVIFQFLLYLIRIQQDLEFRWHRQLIRFLLGACHELPLLELANVIHCAVVGKSHPEWTGASFDSSAPPDGVRASFSVADVLYCGPMTDKEQEILFDLYGHLYEQIAYRIAPESQTLFGFFLEFLQQ